MNVQDKLNAHKQRRQERRLEDERKEAERRQREHGQALWDEFFGKPIYVLAVIEDHLTVFKWDHDKEDYTVTKNCFCHASEKKIQEFIYNLTYLP